MQNIQNIIAQRWVFTINNPKDETLSFLKDPNLFNINKNIILLVCELEHTEEGSGTPHIQGYIEYKQRTTRKKVLSLIPFQDFFVEKANGNRASNIKYCTKEGSDHIVCYYIDESIKKLVEKQLSKSEVQDLDQQALEMLQDIGDLQESEFEAKYPRFYLRNYNKYKELQHVKQQKHGYTYNGDLQKKNLWIWGPTGTGKSRIAHDGLESYEIYFKNINKWWNGYEHGIKRVIIEDYPCISSGGNALVQHMKIWADRYTFTGEIKGAHTNIAPSFNLIVTSNYNIDQCFSSIEDAAAIKRRFHEIYFDQEYASKVHNSYSEMINLEFPESSIDNQTDDDSIVSE